MFAASKSGKPASGVAPTTDPNFNNTVLLLETTGTNGQQNNTFLDSSTGAFTITRVGTPTQGTFTPFSQTGWSGYFSGTEYLTTASSTIATGDFTYEMWVYQTSSGYCIPLKIGDESANRTQIFVNGAQQLGWGVFGTADYTLGGSAPIKQWNHIAIVRLGTTVTGYVNGVAAGTTTTYSGTAGNVNGFSVAGNVAGTSIIGYVSNARVNNTTALYTANFTPSTTPLTAISGTSLLTLQSNYFKDNSSNNFAITATGTPSIQALSPFAPAAAYSTATVGGSVYFNGTTDELVKSGVADTASGDFTIEYWVYFNSAGAIFQTPITTYSANNSIFHQTYLDTFYFYPPNNISTPFVTFTFAQSQWYHIATVRSGSTVTAYVNGVALTPTTTVSSTLTLTTIGIGDYTGGISYPFGGYISNLRIVKSAVYTANFTPPTAPLTAITNTALLLSGTNAGIYDATAKNNEITVGAAQASTAQSQFGGSSMLFNGTTSYLTFIDSPVTRLGTGNFTIEGWVYLTTAAGAIKSIVSKGTSTTGWSVCISTGGQLNFIYSAITIGSSGVLAINTWYYFAVVRSGTAVGNVKLYLNGTLTYTSTVAITTDFNQTNTGYVGASRVGATLFPGYIDELRISRVARTISLPTAAFPTS